MTTFDVIVVGAGVEGSATALHLARDGQKTLLLEQFPLPHSRGSSHGQSRITRRSYVELFYSEMMAEATKFWEDLQRFSGVQIYNPVGFMAIGRQGGQYLRDNKNSMMRTGAPFTELDSEAFRQRYAMFTYPSDYAAILDPEGGLLRADRILNLLQKLFRSYGGEVRDGQRVLSVTPQGPHSVQVTTDRGHVTSRSVVLCCGPWTSDLTTGLGLSLPLQPVRITVCYWKEKEPGRYGVHTMTPFFDNQCCAGHDVYGLPSDEYPGCVKVCLHHGPDIHPDRRDVADHSWVVPTLSEYVHSYLPFLEPSPAVVETCIYTNTPDKHFILDTHPTWKNIVIGAGFSGHGFKLAPAVGRVLSQLAQGKDPSYDLTPFRISRFSPKSLL